MTNNGLYWVVFTVSSVLEGLLRPVKGSLGTRPPQGVITYGLRGSGKVWEVCFRVRRKSMSNMGYCRFQNTLKDLQDCLDSWDEGLKDDVELQAKTRLLELCKDIVAQYGDTM